MTVNASASPRPRRRRLWLAAPLIVGGLAVGAQPALGTTLPTDLDATSVLPLAAPSLSVGDTIEVLEDLDLHAGDSVKVGADGSIEAGDVVAAGSDVTLEPDESLLLVQDALSLDADQVLSIGDALLGTLPDLGEAVALPELPISVPALPGVPVVAVPQLPLLGVPTPGPDGKEPAGTTHAASPAATPAATSAPQVAGTAVSPVAIASGCRRVVLRTTIAGPARMKTGKKKAFRITVRNRSVRPALRASVKLTLPRGFKVLGRAPKGTVVRKSTVTWRVGKVAAYRTRTLRIIVRSPRTSAARVAVKAVTRGQCAVTTRSKRVVKVTPTLRRR